MGSVTPIELDFLLRRAREEFVEHGLPIPSGVAFVTESALKSFHRGVLNQLEGKGGGERYFVRHSAGVCTGLVRFKHSGRNYIDLLGFAAHKGTGARLHLSFCRALMAESPDAVLRLTLQQCLVRSGGFYLKMGWSFEKADVKLSRDVGKIMLLDLKLHAWEKSGRSAALDYALMR